MAATKKKTKKKKTKKVAKKKTKKKVKKTKTTIGLTENVALLYKRDDCYAVLIRGKDDEEARSNLDEYLERGCVDTYDGYDDNGNLVYYGPVVEQTLCGEALHFLGVDPDDLKEGEVMKFILNLVPVGRGKIVQTTILEGLDD